jgi:hypothetical protein
MFLARWMVVLLEVIMKSQVLTTESSPSIALNKSILSNVPTGRLEEFPQFLLLARR